MEMEMERQSWGSFPEEALEHVLAFIDSRTDRSSVSLVCKSWYDIDRWCRRHIFIGNCYAVNPSILIRRFSHLRSITIKGKHMAADYNLVPDGWGAHALPWIQALVSSYPALEEITFKRMVLTDQGLELIATNLKNLTTLILRRCEGFSTHGLASIAANSRNLRILDLYESEVDDQGGDWVTHFPDSYTALESLNVDILKSQLPLSTINRFFNNCPNLKSLRLPQSFLLVNLLSLLLMAPTRLVDLGIGLFTMDMEPSPENISKLAMAFAGCNGLKSLSGLWDANPCYLPTLYPLCSGLTSLNLKNSTLRCPDLVKLLRHCPNLQCLRVLDYIEDRGLEEVATSCKELRVLKVYFSDPYYSDALVNLTEKGLVSVARGCPKLHYIMYFCNRMTNAALLEIAKHRPNLTALWLCIHEPQLPDHLTGQPLDIGFTAILECCKSLKSLAVTGLVTDRLLHHIGMYGNKLEALWLIFAGESDAGLHSILSGCENLRKLWVRDCPFSGQVLLANFDRLERMRSLWMFSCNVSYRSCKLLAETHPRLNFEVINENGPLHCTADERLVEGLYVYRTVAGPRLDFPAYVQNINQIKVLEDSLKLLSV